ncbi:fimbrial protein [Enterobacter mori]|uniref:fimbrial protein n=1 Tax=Enterobacter mori TaxID=539813 RepID=UPI003B841334
MTQHKHTDGQRTVIQRLRLLRVPLLCTALSLVLPGIARAADTCTGWGGEVTKFVDLGLPATLDLTTSNGTAGTILASGSVGVPPLTCVNDAGQAYSQTAVNWMTGSSAQPDIRTLAPGLGLRLKYVAVDGGTGTLPSTSAGTHSVPTNGLNWAAVNWELIRLAGTLTPGSLSSANVATVSLGANADGAGTWPTLWLKNSTPVIVSASCVLSVDKTLIILPDTSTLTLKKEGVSESVPLTAGITCPENTFINNGTTLTLDSAVVDSSDITLVGNTGTSSGVGIEVLGGDGNRVSASGGTVRQAVFTQGSSAAPGATQSFSVRMKHLPNTEVTPGTIQGTFTLTLTLN